MRSPCTAQPSPVADRCTEAGAVHSSPPRLASFQQHQLVLRNTNDEPVPSAWDLGDDSDHQRATANDRIAPNPPPARDSGAFNLRTATRTTRWCPSGRGAYAALLPTHWHRADMPPSQKEDSSPASFERTLSALSAKITTTQTQLEKVRSRSRRVKVLSTLYLGFAYLVYAIVLMLVVGWKHMGPLEWTGMAGGPAVIYLVRTISTAIFDYRINALNARLKVLQVERSKTIQKLKDATKYDSTLQLLEKYGDSENKPKGGKTKAGEEDTDGEKKRGAAPKQGHGSGRTGLPPPPTANIQRHPPSGPGTPQPQQRVQSPLGTPAQPTPRSDINASAEFAPNAFDGRAPPAQLTQLHHAPASMAAPEHHWYDRILDTLLGEDETAAKNRIVMICGNCRLVNGQAPPGTKSLSDLGTWKCMACGASNGELDEGKRIVQEVLGKRTATAAEATDEEGAGDSSDMVEVDKDDIAEGNTGRDGLKLRKGKGN